MYVWYTVLVQKGNKDIIKVVHVTSMGYIQCFESLKIHFGPSSKYIKYNYDFFQHCIVFQFSWQREGE